MKILVVGGAGYIGSVTVEQLVAGGHSVVVLDDLSRGHRHSVAPQAKLVVGDYGDRAALDQVLGTEPFDAAMHFGASSLVGESVSDPLTYYRNNLGKGIELVRALVDHGVRRLIFSSTAATFGEPQVTPIREEDPQIPTNPYGRTKLYFEHFLADCDRAYGFKSVCLRYFNAAGASERYGEDHTPETHLIPLILETAAGKREKVSVFGDDYPTRDGTCVRDYVHVLDLAQAHILALEELVRSDQSERYNLGNGEGYTVLEVLEAAERVTGRKVNRTVEGRRAGDPAVLVASSEKIRSRLGWTPRYPGIDEIIGSAWRWMEKQNSVVA